MRRRKKVLMVRTMKILRTDASVRAHRTRTRVGIRAYGHCIVQNERLWFYYCLECERGSTTTGSVCAVHSILRHNILRATLDAIRSTVSGPRRRGWKGNGQKDADERRYTIIIASYIYECVCVCVRVILYTPCAAAVYRDNPRKHFRRPVKPSRRTDTSS